MTDQDDTLNILLHEYLEKGEKITEKHRRILEAAVEVFAEKGFSAASTSEIAQRAGVAEGTIFRHYKTKKDLLISIVSPTFVKLGVPIMLREFEKVLGASYNSFDDFLRAIIQERYEFARKNIYGLKILLHEAAYHPELQKMVGEVAQSRILPRLEPAIKHFQQRGEIKRLPVLTVIRLMVTTFIGYIITRLLVAPEYAWDDEQEIDIMVEFLVQGLAPGIEPSGETLEQK